MTCFSLWGCSYCLVTRHAEHVTWFEITFVIDMVFSCHLQKQTLQEKCTIGHTFASISDPLWLTVNNYIYCSKDTDFIKNKIISLSLGPDRLLFLQYMNSTCFIVSVIVLRNWSTVGRVTMLPPGESNGK